MPNWVYNRVHGSKDVIAALLNSKGQVTFTNVIPIPPAMKALEAFKYEDPRDINALINLIFNHDDSGIKELSTYSRFEGKSLDDIKQHLISTYPLSQLSLCKQLKDEFGTFYWYDWRCANWGCKWDAGNEFTPDGGYPEGVTEIEFKTPWSPPEPIMRKLVDNYPDLEFTWHYDEESCAFSADFVACGDGNFFEEDVFPEYYTPYIPEPQDLECAGLSTNMKLSEAKDLIREELGQAYFDLDVTDNSDGTANITLAVYDWEANGRDKLYEYTWEGFEKDA